MIAYLRLAVAATLLLQAGCAIEPSRGDSPAEQGYRALAVGDLQAAEGLLVQAHTKDPTDAELLVTLGELYQETGRPAQAREMYINALALAPEVNAAPTEARRQAGLRAIERAGDHLKQLYLAERGELPRPEPIAMVVAEPTPPAAAAPFTHWVQIGYFTRPANARRLSGQFAKLHDDLLQGRAVRLVAAEDGGTRVRIGPFPTKGAADRACLRLRAAGTDCFPGSEGP